MTPGPLVSVIVPFWNAQDFLAEAVESVLTQTYDAWELILADDGSSDNSTALARDYTERFPGRIRYLEHDRHQNRGVAASRNVGVRHAKGAYLAFLDSDDVWLPNKLERQAEILAARPNAAMVCGPSQYWYGWTGRPEDVARDRVNHLGLGQGTLRPACSGDGAVMVGDIVARAAAHAQADEERRLLSRASAHLGVLRDARLPQVFEHRDMGPWNLMVSPKRSIGVLAWESSCRHGIPAWDLFYFLACYGFMVRRTKSRADHVASFLETFSGGTPLAEMARAAVRRYAQAVNLAHEWLGPLFLGCWLHNAVSDVSRHGVKLGESMFWHLFASVVDRGPGLNFLERG